MTMGLDSFRPLGADLDQEIERLVAKRVRGELSHEEELLLTRLVARRSSEMRPARARTLRFG